MHVKITLIVFSALVDLSASAQGLLSPKLNRFLISHPAVAITLSNVLAEASSNRTVEIYYYYTNDESTPRAHHHYIGDRSTLGIFVRENQQPYDECIGILFEALNSKGEKRFMELFKEAKSGWISRVEFVREIMLQEFQAVKTTKVLIRNLKLDPNESAGSESYQYFINSPDDPEEFLAYSK
jgi:hypothetical protein